MDIKQCIREFSFIIFLLCIQDGLTSSPDEDYFDEPSFNRCPWIRNKLKNGRVRYRYKGRVAKFLCDSGFELAGKRSSTCVRGQWSNPVPVCVARGCSRVPPIINGRITEMYRGALLTYDCNPGYMLDGNPTIHCDGRRWSSSPPECVIATENPEVYCDFENPDLCGWSQDPNHDFDWQRNQFSTPSGHVGTGPAFDHTFGENKAGFYMYIEASSPRKRNDTARLFSPVYSKDKSGGCFIFWYHMYGATTGGLKVYLKPESYVFDELKPKWEKYGDQGNQWQKGHMIVPVLPEHFQIVIEGLRGESYVGDSAIDDVRLTTNLCNTDDNSTDITEAVDQYSCRGRCQESGSEASCGCNANCVDEPNFCCRDYHTICTTGNFTTIRNTEEPPPEDYTTPSSVSQKSTTEIDITHDSNHQTTWKSENSETTNYTSFNNSSILTSTSVFKTPDALTTASSVSPISISALYTSTPEYTSLNASTVLSDTITSTSFKTEIPLVSTNVMKTTKYLQLNTTISASTNRLTPTTTPIKTSPSTTTPVKTYTIQTTVLPTTKQIESSTTEEMMNSTTAQPPTSITAQIVTSTTAQTTPKATSTILSRLTSNLQFTTETFTMPVFTNNSTASIINLSTDVVNLYTNSSSSTTALNTKAISLSTTTLSSTRKTYNLRPRNRTASNTLPTVSKTTRAPLTTYPTPIVGTSTLITSSSSYLTSWYKYSVRPSTIGQSTSAYLARTTQQLIPESTSRGVSETTIQNIPQTTKYLKKITKPGTNGFPKTSEFSESGTSKAETTSKNSKMPVVVSIVIVVLLCLTAGIAFYIRRKRNKRQSKLSDDSEMRFLPESDFMEYSDASALDRILVK